MPILACPPIPEHHAHASVAPGAPPDEPTPSQPPTDWLGKLNPQQRAAATFGQARADGGLDAPPLLVIAGAGTGKTATLAHRVAHLIVSGVDPSRVLLLTFSRRAAQEMTRRAERLVAQALAGRGAPPAAVRLPWAGTFHAIGARLLREHAGALGIDPAFGILDRGDAADLVDLLRHELGYSSMPRRFPRKETCLAIYSHRVNTGAPLATVLEESYPWCAEWADELRELFGAYVARKQDNGVLDYDDLLLWWATAMRDPGFAGALGDEFDHVLVDEYQDTNALQSAILLAMKPDGRGLAVVGDDAQSIYAFRAARVENILEFPDRFSPPATRITLETNYRSVQPVLDLANTLIGEGTRQYPKTLLATRGAGALPRLVTVLDERAQADYVIDEVLAQREAGVALREQAVLFRSAHHSAQLEVALMQRNVPFVKYGGLKFLEAAHVKDLLSVLRWADNPRNGIAAFRALQLMSGVGPASARRALAHVEAADGELAALEGFAAPAAAAGEWPGFVDLMRTIADPAAPWPTQLEPARAWYGPILERRHDDAGVRAADLEMLASIAGQFPDRRRFLTELALDPPQASGDLAGDPLLDEDFLVLSTVHSAKGQEWKSVYVLNVADGNFPNEYATGKAAAIEEERRLLYVAVTRARDTLHLIEPRRYFVTGQARTGDAYVHGARSRFLSASVLRCCEARASGHGIANEASTARRTLPRVDVAASLRQMW